MRLGGGRGVEIWGVELGWGPGLGEEGQCMFKGGDVSLRGALSL